MSEKPVIVVLDGYTLNPGDLSWDPLAALGDCTVHERTAPADIIERAKDADIILTNKTVLDRNVLDQLPKLRYIGVMATGYNVVDLAEADSRGIPVTNVPLYATNSVVQTVFAFILAFTQQVTRHSESVTNGAWASSPDFCFWEAPLAELDGLTMGIVGYGRIGRRVGEVARAFGMKLLINNRSRVEPDGPDMRVAGLEDLFRESDIVSLHCPLTEQSKGMINSKTLAMMKKSALLINTGRGPLIVDDDLARALENGDIAGAGLDVLTEEPPRNGNPLIGAKNCLITPHIGWATLAARTRLMDIVVANVRAFLDCDAVNVVNDPK